jgi:hypothetical protein
MDPKRKLKPTIQLMRRIESIQEELQQFFNPNEVIPGESNEQQRNLRISLRIFSTVVESLPNHRQRKSHVAPMKTRRISWSAGCFINPLKEGG